jgi:ABC-type Na+ efflux pump permease subunit
VARCSFLSDGINPFYRDGVWLDKLDVQFLIDNTQKTAASIIEQVAQGTLLRIILPWMIGRAFEKVGDVEFIKQLGRDARGVKFSLKMMAPKFKGKSVSMLGLKIPLDEKMIDQVSKQVGDVSLSEILALMNQDQKQEVGNALQAALKDLFRNYNLTAKTWADLTRAEEPKTGRRPAAPPPQEVRYQILVPSYTVMFAFFLVLTMGWLFAAERRQGTLKRLRAAPLSRSQILLGKLVPCFLLSVAQGLFLLGAGKLVFGMDWGPEPLWVVPVVVATSLAAVGMALVVAAVARTESQVGIYGTVLVFVLAGLSGCMMGDRALMSPQMQEISRITPHAWALDAYRQLLTNPTPNYHLVGQACAVLAAFGLGFTLLAWWTLKLE